MIGRARVSVARLAARFVGAVGRIGGHSGTSLPGRVLLALAPHSLRVLSARIPNGCIVVSATNGKTTTSALIAKVLTDAGFEVVHNSEGANMAGGIASTLLSSANLAHSNAIGLFEVDEFWLSEVVPQLSPRLLVLGNLFRDQLDRYGELDTIIGRWRETVAGATGAGTRVIACADDPALASLAEGCAPESFRWFGIDDRSSGLDELPHASDSSRCRVCDSPLDYELVMLGHLGRWSCPNCGLGRPAPEFDVTSIRAEGSLGTAFTISTGTSEVPVSLPLPGIYNVYNALSAFAVGRALDIEPSAIASSIGRAEAAFGRAESFPIGDARATLLLIKNPVGATEVARTLAATGEGLAVQMILNDGIADGRDISWIWDADLEVLSRPIERLVCSGQRSAELALRMRYAGVDPSRIDVIPDALAGLESISDGQWSEVWVLPTYTALLDLRSTLEGRGIVGPIR